MKMNIQKKYLIFASMLFVISIASFFILYNFINNNIKVADDIEKELQNEEVKKMEIKSFNTLIKSIEKEKSLFDLHFVKKTDIVPFLDIIEQLAKKVGASADIESVETPKEGNGLLIGLKVAGDFESIYKFVKLLENSPYELKIINLSMQKENESASKKEKASNWSATLTVQLLSFN